MELKEQLQELEKGEGQLFVSSDQMDEQAHADTDLVFELIDSFSFEIHAVDPHPAVKNYRRSYLSYITSALNVAEIDIEGTEELLADAQQALEQCVEGEPEYDEALKECKELEEQLEFARYAHSRLMQLELDICTEIKTVVQ